MDCRREEVEMTSSGNMKGVRRSLVHLPSLLETEEKKKLGGNVSTMQQLEGVRCNLCSYFRFTL